MIKKSASLFLAFLMAALLFTSCHNDSISDDSGAASDYSQDVSESIVGADGLVITVGNVRISVDYENAEHGDVRIYNRDYKNNDYILTATVGKDRSCIGVKLNNEGTYSVSKIYSSEGLIAPIPLNGFLLDIPNSVIEANDISFKVGTVIDVENYTSPEFEPLDLASVVPSDKTYSRRINMLYPKDGVFEEDKIYFCSNKDKYTVPQNAVALILKKNGATSYTVSDIAEEGTDISDSYSLLFCGKYNLAYCTEFYKKDQKLTFIKSELLNNITDRPAVSISNELYILDDEHFNSNSGKSGLSVFNNEYGRLVTPAFDGDFLCAVISDDKVIYLSEEKERLIIPSDESYIAVFSGDTLNIGKKLKIGDTVKGMLVNPSKAPDSYVLIDGKQFKYDEVNSPLTERSTVLFSSIYGETTATSQGTLEITILDGRVVSVSQEGNSDIPIGGFVLSFDKNSKSYKNALNIANNAEASLATEAHTYQSYVLQYDKMNATRYADELIIYDGSAGSTTGTNVYGFEIVVDENGIACSGSTSGNSTIPKNGFVVSGHGVQQIRLQELYKIGMSVSYDKFRKTVTFVTSPSLKTVEAAFALEEIEKRLDEAKSQLYAIDYKSIEPRLEKAQALYSKADEELKKGNVDASVAISNDVISALGDITYSLYESSSVENRSVWYRSSEKNDSEVRATVELMSELGINAVYIETWYNGQTIGYSDDPRIKHNSAAHGDYDVLEGFCRIGHEYGIEIHAWCENFFIGTDGYLVDLMKDKRCIDRNGKDRYPCDYGDFIFMNPNDRECRDLVLDVYKELITRYDIDGIHLDYIRFSEPNPDGGDFGYNDDIIKGFQEAYSTNIDPHVITSEHPMWNNWCKYREEIINSFVEEVYFALKAIDSNIYLSAACYPDFPNVPRWNYQNFQDWVNKGYMDEIFSMSYGADLSYPLSNAKGFITAINGKCYYSIGVSAFESTSASILIEQIFYSKQAGASGSSPFSWGSLVNHKQRYFEALKSGVFSKKAVKFNRGSETVIAAMNDLMNNIESTYSYLKPEYTDYYLELNNIAKEIIAKAEQFDYQNASAEDKLQYCQSALTELRTLLKTDTNVDDVALKNAVRRCVNTCINALNITIKRLQLAPIVPTK